MTSFIADQPLTAPVVPASDPLVRLWAAFRQACADYDVAPDAHPGVLESPEQEEAGSRMNAAADAILASPAETLAGVLARLRLFDHWVRDFEVGEDETDELRRLLNGVLRDLQRLAPLRIPAVPHPDAELLRLVHELDEAWARERAVYEAERGNHSTESIAITEAASEAAGNIVHRIEALQATTLDGLRVKARAVSWCYNGGPIDPDAETTDERLASGIVRDLLGQVRP